MMMTDQLRVFINFLNQNYVNGSKQGLVNLLVYLDSGYTKLVNLKSSPTDTVGLVIAYNCRVGGPAKEIRFEFGNIAEAEAFIAEAYQVVETLLYGEN